MLIYPVHVENRSFRHGQKEKTEAGLRPATLYKKYGFHPRRGISKHYGLLCIGKINENYRIELISFHPSCRQEK